MMQRDDFENRLGQGLKRWAASGEPTLDLEAYVHEKVGVEPVRLSRRPWRWSRWVAGGAAAALLVAGVGLTFPSWAGAAAGWPIVGPIVTEIILKDAGLAWAFETGLITGKPLAVAEEDGVTIKILGVMADARRTTVLYQVVGLPPEPQQWDRLVRAGGGGLTGPVVPSERLRVFVHVVGSKVGYSSGSPATETRVGLVGTVETLPLPEPTGELEVTFTMGEREITLTVPASRAEVDHLSATFAVNERKEIDGIAITVEEVTYSPAETIIQYRVETEPFFGPTRLDPETESQYLRHNGERLRATGGGGGLNRLFMTAFPSVSGPVAFVVPAEIKGVPVEAVWPLEPGSITDVLGVPVTLESYLREGDGIRFEWSSPEHELFQGISGFEVIDGSGEVHSLRGTWASEGNNLIEGRLQRNYETELPADVVPVAVRATRAAVKVTGPWVFELPTP